MSCVIPVKTEHSTIFKNIYYEPHGVIHHQFLKRGLAQAMGRGVVQELSDVGFNNLSFKQLRELSIHGVDTGFIQEIIELGLVEDGEVKKALALPEKEPDS